MSKNQEYISVAYRFSIRLQVTVFTTKCEKRIDEIFKTIKDSAAALASRVLFKTVEASYALQSVFYLGGELVTS